jgi:hypothetical protein
MKKVSSGFGLFLIAGVVVFAGCSGSMYNSSMSSSGMGSGSSGSSSSGVITQLNTMTTIGSTVDATNGDNNPYGLAIAPVTAGNITAGDLIVCNFNSSASSNAAGQGTTIEDLSPTAGAKPVRIAQDASLKGCDALALNPTSDTIWAAAYTANDNPIFKPTGALVTTLATNFAWMGPWGQIYAAPMTSMSGGGTYGSGGTASSGPNAFYVSEAQNGAIVQVAITASGFQYNTIATGFPVNLNSQYGILAPAGLTYNASTDTLYIVSSASNSVVALSNASTIPSGGITVTAGMNNALTFGGPAAAQAKVIYSGTPLNYPVSAALLYNGDLIVGNTGDNNMVEINPSTGMVVGEKSVDSGNAGAIFGIATTGTSVATQKIFFNDDNTNSVMEVSQ